MSTTATSSPLTTLESDLSAGDELATLGWAINANQYKIVHAAARFDEELEWVRRGHRSASAWISKHLQVQTSTAAEWVRVEQALRYLPRVDAAFAAQEISYAKVRILTRWADDDNEALLVGLAHERTAGRLTVAISKALADGGETDAERDARLHDERSFTRWTDGDGMTVMRIVLAPSVAKPVVAAVDELARRIAETPTDDVVTRSVAQRDAGDHVDVVEDRVLTRQRKPCSYRNRGDPAVGLVLLPTEAMARRHAPRSKVDVCVCDRSKWRDDASSVHEPIQRGTTTYAPCSNLGTEPHLGYDDEREHPDRGFEQGSPARPALRLTLAKPRRRDHRVDNDRSAHRGFRRLRGC